MPTALVLNELSVDHISENQFAARQIMTMFLKTYQTASKLGIRNSFSIPAYTYYIHNLELCPGYTVHDWLFDKDVKREEQSYFRTIANKSPLQMPEDIDINSLLEWSEYSYDSKICKGFAIAAITNSIAVSFQSDECWLTHSFSIKREFIDSENLDAGGSNFEFYEVKHVSEPSHFEHHKEWIDELKLNQVADGIALWRQKEQMFPKLIFCDNTKEFITDLRSSHPWFNPILSKFRDFQHYCEGWHSGQFVDTAIRGKLSRESESVRNSSHLIGLRTFLCPDGQHRICEWHARLTPNEGRLHFYPDEENKVIYIGYIGRHLPLS